MKRVLIGILIGIVAAFLLGALVYSLNKKNDPEVTSDYFLIQNQIRNMNKMVVVEQDFSTIERTKFDYKFLGQKVSDNTIVTVTKTNAQVSYDLNKMKITVDSVNKKLIISELPKADIKITPSVEIQSMDDSFLNRIDEKDIKKVTQNAKNHAIQSVDRRSLEQRGRKQLSQNLNQIMVLAKALNYQIVDETQTLNTSQY